MVRTSFALLLALSWAGLAGCSADKELSMGAVVVMAPVKAPAPRAEVDPGFTAAVGAYARQVMGLRELDPTATDAEIRRALELLADAVEVVPGRVGPGAPAAAQRIRTDAGLMMFGLRLGPEGTRPVVHALEVSADALGELARGPYRAEPMVQQRMASLREAVARLRGSDEDIRQPRAEVIAALEQAALVLTAMHAAAGRPASTG